jgi:hypothetical protein
MTDLANIAAATSAGYKEVVNDKGVGFSPRYTVTLEKYVTGVTGASGAPVRAYGQGDSQAAAEAQALDGLNGFRRNRYGPGASATNKDHFGGTHTIDLT